MLSGHVAIRFHENRIGCRLLRGLNPDEAGDLHLLGQRGEIACVNGLNNSRNKNGNQKAQNSAATRPDDK